MVTAAAPQLQWSPLASEYVALELDWKAYCIATSEV